MNQEKIGKFILDCRKKKNMTQSELAEKLGVSDRTIGNWENGRNMPDLSLFKPLCDELGITINELLSGENIKKEKYQEKFEENIINTIDYSTRKINLSNNVIGYILISLGILITLSAMTIRNAFLPLPYGLATISAITKRLWMIWRNTIILRHSPAIWVRRITRTHSGAG